MNWRRVAFFLIYAAGSGAAAYYFQSYQLALWALFGFLALVFMMKPLRRVLEALMPLKVTHELLERYCILTKDIGPMLAQDSVGQCRALDTLLAGITPDLFEGYERDKRTLFPHELNFEGYLYLMPRFVFDKKGREVGDLNLEMSQIDVADTSDPNLKRLIYFLHYPVAAMDVSRSYGDVHRYFDGVKCAYTGLDLIVMEVELKPTIRTNYAEGGGKTFNRVLQVVLATKTDSKEDMLKAYNTMRAVRRDLATHWKPYISTWDYSEKNGGPSPIKTPMVYADKWFEEHDKSDGNLRDGYIYFGDSTIDGSAYWVPVKKLSHFLVSGQSGSGKSVFLHQFLAGVAYNEAYFQDVYLIDLKGGVELWRYNGTANGLFHVVYDYDKVVEMVDGLNDLMDERLNDMRERGLREWDGRRVLVVIDEYASLTYEVPEDKEAKATQQKMLARLSRLSSKSRAAGILLWAQLQKGTTDVMDSSFRNNLQSEVMFKQKSKLIAAQVFGATDELAVDPTRMRAGEFVMLDATKGQVVYLKSRRVRGMD